MQLCDFTVADEAPLFFIAGTVGITQRCIRYASRVQNRFARLGLNGPQYGVATSGVAADGHGVAVISSHDNQGVRQVHILDRPLNRIGQGYGIG